MTAPQNIVMVQGQTVASADYLNSLVQWVPNLNTLRTFIGTSTMTVVLLGFVTLNDGGQGTYTWNDLSTAPDDGHTIIVPQGVSQGAWIRTALNPPAVNYPPGGTVNASCGGIYVALGAFTLSLPPSSSLSVTCTMQVFAYGGPVTLQRMNQSDLINGIAHDFIIPKGFSGTIYTDANGNFYVPVQPATSQVNLAVTVAPGGVTGGPNTIVINTNGGFQGGLGQFFFFQAAANNTGPTTIDAGTGPIGVVKNTNLGIAGLGGGEIIAGDYYLVAFNGQYFDLINPTQNPFNILANSPATVAAFKATMPLGLQQKPVAIPPSPATLIKYTRPVLWAPQPSGYYNAPGATWAPPSGWVWIHAQLGFSAAFAADCSLQLWKNGGLLGQQIRHFSTQTTDGVNSMSIQMIDFCNPGEYYQVRATHNIAGGYVTTGSGGQQGWFMGHMI